MATIKEDTVQGYTVQAGTGTLTHTVSAIPHGNPHPMDLRPGYAQPAQPGGHNSQTRIPGGNSAEESLQTVAGQPPVWVQAPTFTKPHGVAFSLFLGVQSGYPLTYAVTAGSLPTGVSLTAATGKLTGNASTSAGTTTVTIQAIDPAGRSASGPISLVLT